jgi:hypothetical protein
MIIKAVKISKLFVPKWNGNDTAAPNDQIRIFFNRIPGSSEKSTYVDMKMDSKGMIQLVYNDSLLASAFIEKVENFRIGWDNGEVEKIDNGQKLAALSLPGIEDLFSEIREYLFPVKEDLEEKESEPLQ